MKASEVLGNGSTENKVYNLAEHVLSSGGGKSKTAAIEWEYEQNFKVNPTLPPESLHIVRDASKYDSYFLQKDDENLIEFKFGPKVFKMPVQDVDETQFTEANADGVIYEGGELPFKFIKLKCTASGYIQGTNLDFGGVSFSNLPEMQLRFVIFYQGSRDATNEQGQYDERIAFLKSMTQKLDTPEFRFPIVGAGASNQRGEFSISFDLIVPPSFNFLDVFLYPELNVSHKNSGPAFIGLKMTVEGFEPVDTELVYVAT